MSNFRKIFVFFCLNICFCSIFTKTESVYASNTREQAYLIEKYLIGHKDNISEYAIKYKFFGDNEIQANLDKIDSIINKLRVIQKDSVGNTSSAITPLLQEIKKVNEEMKVLLKVKKDEYSSIVKKKTKEYQDLGEKLSLKLDEIYLVMYDSRKLEKVDLSEKEKQIVESLSALNILSKEIKYFGLKEYDTEEELQTSFLGALNAIKYHILILRKNID